MKKWHFWSIMYGLIGIRYEVAFAREANEVNLITLLVLSCVCLFFAIRTYTKEDTRTTGRDFLMGHIDKETK